MFISSSFVPAEFFVVIFEITTLMMLALDMMLFLMDSVLVETFSEFSVFKFADFEPFFHFFAFFVFLVPFLPFAANDDLFVFQFVAFDFKGFAVFSVFVVFFDFFVSQET